MSPETENNLRARHRMFAVPGGNRLSRFALDGIAVGDGWAAILDDMATEIEHHCAAEATQLPEVLQVKEKLGTLRVYLAEADDQVRAIIARAEARSALRRVRRSRQASHRRLAEHAVRSACWAVTGQAHCTDAAARVTRAHRVSRFSACWGAAVAPS